MKRILILLITKRSYSLIVYFLLGVGLSHAQEPLVNGKDSVLIYSELFGKYLQNDYQKAIYYGTRVKEIWDKENRNKNSFYCQLVEDLSRLYYSINNRKESLALLTEILQNKKDLYGENSLEFADFLNNLAIYNFDLNNFSEAIRLGTEATETFKRVVGTKNPKYAWSLYNLFGYNSSFGNYSEAIRLGTEVIELFKSILGTENSEFYTSLLYNLASDYSSLGNYSEAIRLGTEVLEIRKRMLGTEHPNYAKSLGSLANYYFHIENYNEAIRLGTEAMEIFKKVLGTEHPDYAKYLDNLALYNSSLGNYSEAIHLGTEAMEIIKKELGMEHPDYAASLSNLAHYNSSFGNYTEAIRLETEAMEIRKKELGKEDLDYAISLRGLALYNYSLGNFSEAIRMGTEAMEIRKRVLGSEHLDYAESLSNLALFYYSIGSISEAIRLDTKAMEIRKRVLGSENSYYAVKLQSLTLYNSSLGNYSEAIHLGTEAMEIIKKELGMEHPDYAASLSNLAHYNSSFGNYSEAIRMGTEAMEIFKKVLGVEHPDYAASLSNLAHYNCNIGNYSEAIRLEIETLKIYEKALGTEHPDYATSLSNLAHYNCDIGNYSEAINLFKESVAIKESIFLNQFNNLPASQRANLWGTESYLFTDFYPFLTYKSQSNNALDLYDKSALFAKGLLLTTEMEMNKLILESGDEEALRMFGELRTQRLQLQKLYETPIAERHINTDSLAQVADQLESKLVERSKVYGDFTRKLRTTWKDVQAALGEDEIAVEFLSFNVLGTDSTMVAALTLRKDDKEPKFIPLFEQGQMEALDDSPALKRNTKDESKFRRTMHFIRPEVTDLIWKPLQEELNGIRRIYFSPAGILHSIGIEYLPGMERYDIRRLSTTREIIDLKEKDERKMSDKMMATLYGGINYEEAITNPRTQEGNGDDVASDSISRSISASIHRALVDSLGLRGGTFEYLPGTLTEVENIKTSFEDKHRQVITGADATEASVQALSAHAPNILHIATHGFYYTEKEKKMMDARKLLTMDDDELGAADLEDKALTRSGMAFAGANKTLRDENNPMDSDDGILTAQEISKLDLRGLDLVVLSACETGMGDITQGEGVFGLQRGFKKAGVGTIVMSLWKVDDNATQMMMTQFYKNLCDGMDKHEALQEAQKHVREYTDENGEKKYNYPHYWAGFIILD